jgi:hypothetical protein
MEYPCLRAVSRPALLLQIIHAVLVAKIFFTGRFYANIFYVTGLTECHFMKSMNKGGFYGTI